MEFISELDLDEMRSIGESLVIVETNNALKKKTLEDMEVFTSEQVEAFKFIVREEFRKGGSKKFIKILKDEFKNVEFDVFINIANKQRDSALYVEKLNNVFVTLANPNVLQFLQTPQGSKLFGTILESAGLPQIDFDGFSLPQPTVAEAVPVA